MEKKTIWTLVLVFAVGLIFGSLAGNNSKLTGQQSLGLGNPNAPDTAVITVDPDMLGTSERMLVTVIPGKNGIDSSDGSVTIHRVNDIGELGVRYDRIWLCEQAEVCYNPGTVDFVIPPSWSPGWYAAVVTDARTRVESRTDFKII